MNKQNAKERVSSLALMFTVGCFLQCSVLLMGNISAIAKQDSWIVIAAAIILYLPIFWLYIKLAELFPGKSLIEINEKVFGRFLGGAVSILYIVHFLFLSTFNTRILDNFISGSLMPETPAAAILFLFLAVCAYAVRRGLETMTRYSAVFTVIVLFVMIMNMVLMGKDMKLENFMPVLSLRPIKYVQAVHSQISLSFSQLVVFFMLFPDLKKPKELKKSFFWGFLIGAGTILIVEARNIAVLGSFISLVTAPAFEAFRLINIANVFTRMELFYAFVLIMLLFFKVSILYFAFLRAVQQFLKIKSYKFLVFPAGAIILCLTLISFDSSIDTNSWEGTAGPFLSLFLEIILPALTLAIALLRGFRKEKEATV